MRIAYVAKHNSGGNDEEGAVTHALRELGHRVTCVHECGATIDAMDCPELVLFHKWGATGVLNRLEGVCPRVFWYFDLVDFPDPALKPRCEARKAWMQRTLPYVELGFCTDGDWVARSNLETGTDKLVWLPQAADGRVVGRGRVREQDIPLLFTGIAEGGGAGRERWVSAMKRRHGQDFHHVERGVYGRRLADLIARSKIVLAPDSPVTDRYWSTRAYTVLGFGGFLMHPASAGLMSQYSGLEVCWHRSMEELHSLIDRALERPEERRSMSDLAIAKTRQTHTYRHRCEELLRVVKERCR